LLFYNPKGDSEKYLRAITLERANKKKQNQRKDEIEQ
jgi:hypothetical protein